jgi:tetratricopeptide (TPR) repeat protein
MPPLPCRLAAACLACLACLPTAAAREAPRRAADFWEAGQTAMRLGQTDQAIAFYQMSLQSDAGLVRSHLSLAAAFLEKGNAEMACAHLGKYLAANPKHLAVRQHYAELLWKHRRYREAFRQYEQFAADLQEDAGRSPGPLVHCHSRLMQIAEALRDEYAEHLHRGIGLYWLAQDPSAEAAAEAGPEGLLCKAACELTLAHGRDPGEARPSWYLYRVWHRLGQRQPAARSLRAAQEAAPFSFLTPGEQGELELARRRMEMPAARK